MGPFTHPTRSAIESSGEAAPSASCISASRITSDRLMRRRFAARVSFASSARVSLTITVLLDTDTTGAYYEREKQSTRRSCDVGSAAQASFGSGIGVGPAARGRLGIGIGIGLVVCTRSHRNRAGSGSEDGEQDTDRRTHFCYTSSFAGRTRTRSAFYHRNAREPSNGSLPHCPRRPGSRSTDYCTVSVKLPTVSQMPSGIFVTAGDVLSAPTLSTQDADAAAPPTALIEKDVIVTV
jgi:hypothetical protein